MLKRSSHLILLLAFLLVVSFPANSFAEEGVSNWAKEAVTAVKENQLASPELFQNYQQNITREEFCMMAVRLYEKAKGIQKIDTNENPFNDIADSLYKDEIIKAYKLKIVSGMGEGKFVPKGNITREQIAVMFFNTINAIYTDEDYTVIDNISFKDDGKIASWSRKAIVYCYKNDIMSGIATLTIGPKQNATREQAMTLLYKVATKKGVLGNSTQEVNLTVKEIAKKANAVVYIGNKMVNGSEALGSGFLISPDGKIVTNYHVIDKAEKLEVMFEDETTYTDVKILDYDKDMDIAVLKIDGKDLPYCELGDSDKEELGNEVVAIGNPFGLQNTLSTGIVSGIRPGLIQITAPISPGSSGGALFNMNGKVIGVTTAVIAQGENIAFAVPINKVKELDLNKNLTLKELFNLEYPQGIMTKPTEVIAEAISPTEVFISWAEVPDADYYLVYESTSYEGPYEKLEDYTGNDRFYWSYDYCVYRYNLPSETTIYYKVKAVINGKESDFSDIVKVTTLMSYENYADKLKEKYSTLNFGENKYKIVFDNIHLNIDPNSGNLSLYTQISIQDYFILEDGYDNGYEKSFAKAYANIIEDLHTYYPGKNIIALVVYYDNNLDTRPLQFEENPLNPSFKPVIYDYERKKWEVFYPAFELTSNYFEDTYEYRWVFEYQ